MHPSFIITEKYTIADSIDDVREQIEIAIKRERHDLSVNIKGRFINDDTFIVSTKWSLVVIRWIESDLVYLKGNIFSEGNKTLVQISIQPNSGLIIAFYGSIILFLCYLIGITPFSDRVLSKQILTFPLLALSFRSIIRFSTLRMKRRFERLLDWSPTA